MEKYWVFFLTDPPKKTKTTSCIKVHIAEPSTWAARFVALARKLSKNTRTSASWSKSGFAKSANLFKTPTDVNIVRRVPHNPGTSGCTRPSGDSPWDFSSSSLSTSWQEQSIGATGWGCWSDRCSEPIVPRLLSIVIINIIIIIIIIIIGCSLLALAGHFPSKQLGLCSMEAIGRPP